MPLQYVRCDIETDPSVVARILLDVWQIPRAALVMQITGGHKYFKQREKIEVAFLDDLIKFVSQSSIDRLFSVVQVANHLAFQMFGC